MIKINPTQIDGQVYAPSSKSEFQRILALSSLSDKISHISYTSKCNDVNAAIEIIKKLGCDVTEETGKITIKANEKVKKSSFHCGESGLLARMFAPIGTLLCDKLTIEGEGSLLNRNMDMVGDALSQLDASVIGNKLPISINGPLVGGKNITIDGSSSSQLLTGLLIALPFLDVVNTIVNVKNPTSIPYIDLTLSTLQKVGVTIHNDNYIQFIIPGRQKIQSVNTTIEGDWSGAAFFLVAGAIAGNISVKGLNLNSKQADKEILTVLKLADAQINISDSEINVSKSKLKAFKFDATNCPDLFPPLAVLSAFCEGTSVILGANRLIDKESNRIESLINVFKLLGITIVVENNLMSITGGVVKGGRVSSHNDHRIAMAAAILALGAEKAVIIDDHEAVRKSFPEFFKLLSQIQINK